MTRIIPENKYFTDESEKWVVNKLKNDESSEDWILLPNLILRSLDERKKEDIFDLKKHSETEIDSVLLVPGRGIVLIEIKSHQDISIGDDGTWYEYPYDSFKKKWKTRSCRTSNKAPKFATR